MLVSIYGPYNIAAALQVALRGKGAAGAVKSSLSKKGRVLPRGHAPDENWHFFAYESYLLVFQSRN
jgi:hypothetical protein